MEQSDEKDNMANYALLYKIRHRKLKIEQQKSHKSGVKSVTPDGWQFLFQDSQDFIDNTQTHKCDT